MFRAAILSLTVGLVLAGLATAQTREEQVLGDQKKVEAEGFWIYNDLARGFAEAKKTGKPLLVTLRCLPCKECVKLDDDLINQDGQVKALLGKFVCVRVVSTNGLDLSLFQFDTDQSFAVFFLNADETIYGRFGTRSSRTVWKDDVSVEGLAKAMQGALDIHAEYPKNAGVLAKKKGPAPAVASPEQFPALKDRYAAKLVFEKGVVQKCIHCHMIGDALRDSYRKRKEAIPEDVLFPYPHPKALGLILDPKEKATVADVEKGSLADKAGFQEGDEVLTLGGQPLLSIADVQWVLHRASPNGASLKAEVKRGGKNAELTLDLPKGWRRQDDISWRVSSWGLRRMGLGGMVLEELSAEDRKKAGAPETGMALRIKFLGQYGAHAAAKNAGFQQGDVLISFADQSDLARESDLFAYAINGKKPGDKVPVTVLRAGKKVELTLPMQE